MIRKNEFLIMDGASYVAPSMSVMELHNEGLLCLSGELKIAEWQLDNEELNF